MLLLLFLLLWLSRKALAKDGGGDGGNGVSFMCGNITPISTCNNVSGGGSEDGDSPPAGGAGSDDDDAGGGGGVASRAMSNTGTDDGGSDATAISDSPDTGASPDTSADCEGGGATTWGCQG